MAVYNLRHESAHDEVDPNLDTARLHKALAGPSPSGGCIAMPSLKEISMSDDPKDRGPRERSQVDVSEDWELKYWSEKFGVNKADLKEAVESVGPMISDIEAFFNSTLDRRIAHAPGNAARCK